jgi:outer membrane lipoprotein-sorting protein
MTRTAFLLLIYFLLPFPFLPAHSQSRQDPYAEKILDEMGRRYKKLPGFRAEFTRESQNNAGEAKGRARGTILVSGSQYRLKTGNTTLFCDGKTVWTADGKAKEISIAEYDPEADDITPERIYTFYQKGYKYIFMGEVKSGNRILQTIDLEPENINKEISKIRLFVDKKTLEIWKWIIFERGSNEREEFIVDKFVRLKSRPGKEIQFNKAEFPGFKTVDLR